MKQWFYRGSLKSCNYNCSYCPFSKNPSVSSEKLKRDEKDLVRFTDRILKFCEEHFAVMITPYGEALIHSYYIREMARLSLSPYVDFVGCQSNFSFSVSEILKMYEMCGGIMEKLRLWGTFHPEMILTEDFAEKCRRLYESRVSFSVGAVGIPEKIDEIRKLRELLPEGTYLWINRMEGLKRAYTDSEIKAFLKIDPYFFMELSENKSNKSACLDSVFVDADGTMKHCCLSGSEFGNLYEDDTEDYKSEGVLKNPCTRKRCSCFLAYCTQKKPELSAMGKYPMFRIPSPAALDVKTN